MHFLFPRDNRGKLDDLYNPYPTLQLKTDMFYMISYCDSLQDLRAHDQHRQLVSTPAVWTVMLRPVESIDSTVRPVTVIAADTPVAR